jgi:uncharacterized repeat protein (TIGR03847 family)
MSLLPTRRKVMHLLGAGPVTRRIIEYRLPERFVVGTVGMPGERTFYLQAKSAGALTAIAFEKQQAIVLAERIDDLLDEVRVTRDPSGVVPERAPHELLDAEPLDMPLLEEFRVGAMALGWDEGSSCVVIEAHAIAEESDDVPELGEDGDEGPDTLRVWLSAPYARAFADRTRRVADSGREPCPFCQQALDPEGHICPRANGYKRRDF